MAINTLRLLNYRNHIDKKLDNLSEINFIVGDNGAGKTNILEAISLLAPGKGFRGAMPQDIFHNDNGAIYPAWAAHYNIADSDISVSFTQDNGRDQKLVKLDNQIVRGSARLLQTAKVVWLIPQMCYLLIQSAEDRRKFWDRLAYNYDASHAVNITQYKKLVRSRMKLLKDEGPTANVEWLNTLEQQISSLAQKIVMSRSKAFSHIIQSFKAFDWVWMPEISMKNKHCNYYSTELYNWDEMPSKMQEHRMRDSIIGRTTIGPHTDDFMIKHSGKEISGQHCSTGEQKSMIIKVIVAHLHDLCNKYDMPIILLLDDILAHIDNENKHIILDSITNTPGVQKWITTTPDDFDLLHKIDDLPGYTTIRI